MQWDKRVRIALCLKLLHRDERQDQYFWTDNIRVTADGEMTSFVECSCEISSRKQLTRGCVCDSFMVSFFKYFFKGAKYCLIVELSVFEVFLPLQDLISVSASHII